MAFTDAFLEEVAARNDIIDVISQYVTLSRRTGGNQFGLCPFHSEKTPSFSVSSDKQMFYCFGCHKGGSVIHFIMEIESLPFPEAVAHLASRAGLALPEESQQDREASLRRARLFDLNREAARFFRAQLSTPAGQAAVEYISKRGLSKEIVLRFGIGVAPNSWNALCDQMTRQGFTQEELLAAGLARLSPKTGGIYDGFRNRLMFPVIDIRGNVIAFSGRILDDGEPKYLNTSDTSVFQKSRNLFGLNLAKKSPSDYFLLVEGNIDVVALFQAGFDNAIAPLGTAFTPDQARLMLRYKSEVVLCFDSDAAGQKATDRAISILEKTGIRVRVLRLPQGKDPDDFIRHHGRDAFLALLDQRKTHMEHRLLGLQQKYDLTLDPDRVAYLQEAEGLLAKLTSDVEFEVYARRVAEQTGISFSAIQTGVLKQKKALKKNSKRKIEREGIRTANLGQTHLKSLHYENAYSAAAEEGILRLMLSDPALFSAPIPLDAADFSSAFLARTYTLLLSRILERKENSLTTLAPYFNQDEMGQITRLFTQPENLQDGKKSLEDYIEKIKTEQLKVASKEKLKVAPEQYIQEIYAKYRNTKGGNDE